MSRKKWSEMRRPVEVTNAVLIIFMVGVFSILIGLGVNGAGSPASGSAVFLGVIAVGLGVLEIVFGVGALLLKPWGWWLGLSVQLANIISVIAGWLAEGFNSNRLLIVVFSCIILWYLFRPKVRAAFQSGML
jgi:hypothetical protein